MLVPAPRPATAPAFPSIASWLEIDATALRRNLEAMRRVMGPGVRIGSVVKGNAYGHGLAETLPALHAAADVLYVITPQDAFAIRDHERRHGAPRRQVLVLGPAGVEETIALAREEVDLVVADASFAAIVPALREAGLDAPLRAHLHIDTGLGREGFTLADVPARTAFLTGATDVVRVAGVLSHFANTEDVTDQEYATSQLNALEEAIRRLQAERILPANAERHVAASAAAMLLPRARLDAVRIGIATYGLWPSSETKLSARVVLGEVPKLEPVLAWRCRSQAVKWLAAGSFVGYGCTYRCDTDTRVAVLPVGYFDGYPRLVSGRAHVLVNGHRCPVLGRVMMNHIVVDVTRAATDDAPVVATLIGHDGHDAISVEQLANWAQTINYEVVTRLGAHLQRVVR